jgi:isopentenyl diphosphate isomerase/L-lactate dehydrogenase-like FMN-dependent dehydrogenase
VPDFMMIDNVDKQPLGGFRSLYQMVEQAEERMATGEWTNVAIAAGTGSSLRRNRLAFEALAFRQRVCRDVSDLDLSTELLGFKLPIPVMICPMGGLENYAYPNAVVDAAKAATAAGIPIATSSAVKPEIETIAAEAAGVKFYQLYIRGDADHIAASIERAKAAGYLGIIITADAPYFSIRDYPNFSKNFRLPVAESGKVYGAKMTWKTFEEIVQVAAPLPVIIKGIQTAEDAVLAVEHGASAVEVSNHGGRELDHVDATITMLPEVAQALNGAVPIILDSGIRRGTDVVKALALGATAVGVGRLALWSMAAGGEAGVTRMLDLLAAEIGNTMGLLGVSKISELDPGYLRPVQPLAGYQPVFRLADVQPV